ncbi:MAG: DUF1003 domain-containing protein [Acidobacteria bacterium]|nr:DUF1003 domain-containing protein [Acidobacteriota bacterium]
MSDSAKFLCGVCGKPRTAGQLTSGELLRPHIYQSVHEENPAFGPNDSICSTDLNRFRAAHMERLLEDEKGELSELEEQVIRSIREEEILTENINEEFEQGLTFGDRVSDKIAEFGGSWRFILSFGGVLIAWIALNTIVLTRRPFDPFPYILLNLVLSCVAALQAPVIMMSQNRQETKDRLRSENDYRVNLKSELEIRVLNERMEHLLKKQWQRLLEIQEIQTDLIRQLVRDRPTRSGS